MFPNATIMDFKAEENSWDGCGSKLVFVGIGNWAGFEHDTTAERKKLAWVKVALLVPHVP